MELLGCLEFLFSFIVEPFTMIADVIHWDAGGPRTSPDGDFETIDDALPFLRWPKQEDAGTR